MPSTSCVLWPPVGPVVTPGGGNVQSWYAPGMRQAQLYKSHFRFYMPSGVPENSTNTNNEKKRLVCAGYAPVCARYAPPIFFFGMRQLLCATFLVCASCAPPGFCNNAKRENKINTTNFRFWAPRVFARRHLFYVSERGGYQ